MRLLYAEDEKTMAEAVTDVLKYHNYTVDTVYDGRDAYDYACIQDYDGIILDVMMPSMSGIEVLEALRNNGNNTPVLLLTAKSEVEDRIAGLDAGADDYLPKPFSMKELMARIRAMLRRKEAFTPNVLTVGNISLNMQNYQLSGEEKSVTLTKLEYQIMELLMLNTGTYLSTEDILTKVWGYDTEAEIGVVWVYISYLRKHLAALKATVKIHARRNIGYKLEVVK